MNKYLPILKKSFLFSGIEDSQLLAMLNCLQAVTKEYPKSSFILHTGDSVSTVGLVLSGTVQVIKEDFWGNRTILNQIAPGQLFAESFSCAQTDHLPISVVSPSHCEIMFFNYKKIIATCSSACQFHTRLIQNMLRSVAQKNISLTTKIEHMSQKTTREKLLSYLSEQAHLACSHTFSIPFNRQQLADYLSVDRSAMSSELSRMRNEGLLTFERNHFILETD